MLAPKKKGKSRREKIKSYSGTEAFNFYLGVFFPETQLKIFDYNRVVKDLNQLSESEFINKLRESFSITKINTDDFKPCKKH